jgi:RNA polymerase sigma-70 factor, ECF subfamily
MEDEALQQPDAREARGPRLERLFTATQPALLRYLRAFAPGVADDVASVVWVEVIGAFDRFSGSDEEFRRWLFVTGRRRLIDTHRRAWRRRTVPRPPDHSDLVDLSARNDVMAEALETEAAIALLTRLPRDQAEVVLLRVLGGFTADEVGLITGRPGTTVRVLQHRALRRLAEDLRRDGETK